MPEFAFEKIVIVTRKTALEELIERFNSQAQARFYIEQLGGNFDHYADAHAAFYQSRSMLDKALPEIRCQWIDRAFLTNFLFGPKDLVIVLGQDGLVVNTAKYLADQPLLAFNPDPNRIDGVLLPFAIEQCGEILNQVTGGQYGIDRLTMAQASLNTGESILAVNDLFIGYATHASARYRIMQGQAAENQSSSGIIVSTGAGSTGWSRSILTGAAAIIEEVEQMPIYGHARHSYRFDYRADCLKYYVREPFISRSSQASMVTGLITPGAPLVVTSQMPSRGVIFSDGVEQDYLTFVSGATATISVANRKVSLIVPG